MKQVISALLGLVLAASAAAGELSSTAPAQARAYIITPGNGQTVESPFTVRFIR